MNGMLAGVKGLQFGSKLDWKMLIGLPSWLVVCRSLLVSGCTFFCRGTSTRVLGLACRGFW